MYGSGSGGTRLWLRGLRGQVPSVLVSSGRRNGTPQTGQLKQGSFTAHGSGSWKFNIKVPVQSGPGEGPVADLQTAGFCPHLAERGSSALSFSADKDPNPIVEVPSSGPHRNLATFQRSQLPIPIPLGPGLQPLNVDGAQTLSPQHQARREWEGGCGG